MTGEGAAPIGPPAEKPKGPPIEQVQRTLAFVTERFRAFYHRSPPEMPPRFGRREFGFLPEPRIGDRTPFFRHMGMRSREDLYHYLVQRAPHHCYYSTAYYKDPDQSTMQGKGWLGADLIFDLDADHLSEEAKSWPFGKQLDVVKGEAVKLLEEFVLGDLGFDADHVRLVFSGGRGFHIHVDDPRVLSMDAAARREVVDYVTGRGIELSLLVKERTASTRKGFQGRTEKEKLLVVPRPADAGWAGRYSRGLIATLEEMASLPDGRSVVKWAKARDIKGIGEKKAEELLDLARRADVSGRSQIQLIREGQVSHPLLMQVVRIEELGVHGVNEEKGESDEPVTADVKRLIRLPGSIHGKTGLRVTPVAGEKPGDVVDALRAFDPLRDAVAFGDAPIRVVVSKPEAVRLGEEEYACEPGDQVLPERYALFLMLRRKALLPP